ncbi:MAG: prepilin-type N-terminal cleavage/methylation domain-containing protein [Sulfuricurvum sp.]|nr:prepilin-type N-terminal cleavage/methylation domain-containing protein [Sulfuricurvum sp.]
MSIKSFRLGFTLIELVVVVIILGIVATLVTSRLSTLADHTSVLTPSNLKSYLKAFSATKRLDLFCYDNCSQCDLWQDDKIIKTGLLLEGKTAIKVRQYDRSGHLIQSDPSIMFTANEMKEGCFTFSLYPDGTTSPLILESDGYFYGYTPLSGSSVFTERNEEQLRDDLYDTSLMRVGSYYGKE